MKNDKSHLMERNHGIDKLKAICAFLVVFIHFPIKGWDFMEPLDRCAVPCFFIISGYCIYENSGGYFVKEPLMV